MSSSESVNSNDHVKLTPWLKTIDERASENPGSSNFEFIKLELLH